jgi:uncharacterized coiled-coil DUF342 family protein
MKSLEKQYCETAKALEKSDKAYEKLEAQNEKIKRLEAQLEKARSEYNRLYLKRNKVSNEADKAYHALCNRVRQTASDCLPAEPSEKKNALFCEMFSQLEQVTGKKLKLV